MPSKSSIGKSDKLFAFPKDKSALVKIQRSLEEYGKEHCDTESLPIDLSKAYDFLKDNDGKNRLWAALIDFLLAYLHLFRSFMRFSINWSDEVVGGQDTIQDRLDLHYDLSSFTIRYRAVWDKFMGVYLLLYAPNKYKDFWKANSKRKYFLNFLRADLEKHELATYMEKVFNKFEKEFRTGEIHGSGKLRLWSFLPPKEIVSKGSDDMKENMVFHLVMYYNTLLQSIHVLGHCLSGEDDCSCYGQKKSVKVKAISKKKLQTAEISEDDIVRVKNFFD